MGVLYSTVFEQGEYAQYCEWTCTYILPRRGIVVGQRHTTQSTHKWGQYNAQLKEAIQGHSCWRLAIQHCLTTNHLTFRTRDWCGALQRPQWMNWAQLTFHHLLTTYWPPDKYWSPLTSIHFMNSPIHLWESTLTTLANLLLNYSRFEKLSYWWT